MRRDSSSFVGRTMTRDTGKSHFHQKIVTIFPYLLNFARRTEKPLSLIKKIMALSSCTACTVSSRKQGLCLPCWYPLLENSAPVPVFFLGYPRRRRLAGDGTAYADELGTLEMIGGIGRRRSRAQMLPNLIEGDGEPT